jgi:hypothetical protein
LVFALTVGYSSISSIRSSVSLVGWLTRLSGEVGTKSCRTRVSVPNSAMISSQKWSIVFKLSLSVGVNSRRCTDKSS